MLTPPLFQRPGNGNDNDAGPPPLFQRPGDGDDDDAGPSPLSETWGRRQQLSL